MHSGMFHYDSLGCEQLHREAFGRAHILGTEGSKVRIPVCDQHGDFNPIQCDPATSKCWCVDEMGLEVPGTRAAARELVNCTGQSQATLAARFRTDLYH